MDSLYPAPGLSGSAHSLQGISLNILLSSTVVAGSLFVVEILTFSFLRPRIRHLYEPKTILVPNHLRRQSCGPGFLAWIGPLFSLPLDDIRTSCCLEDYFFLRYLRTILLIFSTVCPFLTAILIPLNIASQRQDLDITVEGLDRLSWAGISSFENPPTFIAHLMLCIAFVLLLFYILYYELSVCVSIRQRYSYASSRTKRPSHSTILIKQIPKDIVSEEKLLSLFKDLPGQIKNIWINRDFSLLVKTIKRRDKILEKLEIAETKFLKQNLKVSIRNGKLKPAQQLASLQVVSRMAERMTTSTETGLTSGLTSDLTTGLTGAETGPYSQFSFPATPFDFPRTSDTQRVSLPCFHIFGIGVTLPFLSTRISSLTWYKAELNRLNREIEALQSCEDKFPLLDSCFIQFDRHLAAHLTSQSIIFQQPGFMGRTSVEIDPRDIRWDHLGTEYWKETTFRVLATVCNLIMLAFWAIPSAIVGLVSQIEYLSQLIPGLSKIMTLPSPIIGLLSGFLPSVALSTLLSVVPHIFRCLARAKGYSSKIEVELDVQSYLFMFLFIQMFLVISISSGFVSTLGHVVGSPLSLAGILAHNLPKAANFFCSHFVLQGLGVSGDLLLQPLRLAELYILSPIFDITARQKFARLTSPRPFLWGSSYPAFTTLACIGIVYSVIAPITLVFCVVAFSLFFLAFKYRLMFCHGNYLVSMPLKYKC